MKAMDAAAQWKNVWKVIDARRIELGWNKTRLYSETGTSDATFREVKLRGVSIKAPERLSAICRALGWTPDSIDRILAGGQPVLTDGASDGGLVAELTRLVAQLSAQHDLRDARAERLEQRIARLEAALDLPADEDPSPVAPTPRRRR